MPLLTVRDFAKSFHIHHLDRHIPVFADVHLTLDAGRFLLISGANGAGKSSLLRCLYRTYLPTGGSALYESRGGMIDLARAADIDIAHLRRDEIGFVTQFLRPRPRVSALDLVAEPLFDLMPLAEAHARAGDLLDAFGLKRDLWGAYPTTFSGGEQQKVNLARALIRPRRLLLLDEPTASLDRATRVALTDRLAAIKADGTAMIAVLHHPEDMAALIDTDLTLHPLHPEAASHVAE